MFLVFNYPICRPNDVFLLGFSPHLAVFHTAIVATLWNARISVNKKFGILKNMVIYKCIYG
jgi:hypothetical protein